MMKGRYWEDENRMCYAEGKGRLGSMSEKNEEKNV